VRGAAALVGLALIGCGGEKNATQPESEPGIRSAEHDAREIAPEPQGTEPNNGSPGSDDPSGGKIDIAIRGNRFRPAVMRLGVGHIIVFTNEDRVAHTVRADGGDLPRSGAIPPGGRFEYTALRPGRIRYRCAIHPAMTGDLVVR
jgi:plastocyanin